MMDLIAFILLNFLGVMSPGPDFAVVTQYGLSGSRRSAFYATLGIVTALLIHVLYCVSGVALFLSASPEALLVIKVLGSLYLGYLGLKIALQNSSKESNSPGPILQRPFATGFFTNLLNPKAMLFLLSLFSLFADAMDSFQMKVAFGLSIPLVALAWFSTLAYCLTHPYFLPFLQKHRKKFMYMMSMMLLLLSVSGIASAILE